MADPTSPTLAALAAVSDYLDHVRERDPRKRSVHLSLFEDGCGVIRIDDRQFGAFSRPIAEAYEACEAWLSDPNGTDEAIKALDSEIGENVDHIFAGTAT